MSVTNLEGSNKASSYIRAIELLDAILAKNGGSFADCHDVYAVDSVALISELYEFVLEQQRLAEDGMFAGEEPVSYWRDRYCSAALKSYKEFLILYPYRERLWDLYNQRDVEPADLTRKIDAVDAPFEELVEDKNVDFATREGKEKMREVKMRVNQDFFREMILCEYNSECCLTGLNVPGVLRASHIVGWAEDKQNRMNPANGLCLSATYDAAFDRHLISFDEDYRMILSAELKDYCENETFKIYFSQKKGQQMNMPKRFPPNQTFLEKHREKLVG